MGKCQLFETAMLKQTVMKRKTVKDCLVDSIPNALMYGSREVYASLNGHAVICVYLSLIHGTSQALLFSCTVSTISGNAFRIFARYSRSPAHRYAHSRLSEFL